MVPRILQVSHLFPSFKKRHSLAHIWPSSSEALPEIENCLSAILALNNKMLSSYPPGANKTVLAEICEFLELHMHYGMDHSDMKVLAAEIREQIVKVRQKYRSDPDQFMVDVRKGWIP